jgi:5'-3' exonuclease
VQERIRSQITYDNSLEINAVNMIWETLIRAEMERFIRSEISKERERKEFNKIKIKNIFS